MNVIKVGRRSVMNFKQLVIICLVAILGSIGVVSEVKAQTPAKPAQTQKDKLVENANKCTKDALLAGYGWSAAYGAGIMVVGGIIGLATAPVSLPVGVAVIGVNVITGGALGIGSSAVTRISDDVRFEKNPVALACLEKVKKEMGLN